MTYRVKAIVEIVVDTDDYNEDEINELITTSDLAITILDDEDVVAEIEDMEIID